MKVIMFSGGVGSWYAAKLVPGKKVLLFADTLMEDEDLYRFLPEAAANVGEKVTRIADGRDVWQVFFDKRYLGNSRIDPCSRILKRELCKQWIYDHGGATVYVGIDWMEEHRLVDMRRYWHPFNVRAPMVEQSLSKGDAMNALRKEGIRPPRLYGMGFSHNNCGGFCVKAGQGHFRLLLEQMPEVYLYHERREQQLRQYLGKNVTILRVEENYVRTPITLREFRLRVQAGQGVDEQEIGGCACV